MKKSLEQIQREIEENKLKRINEERQKEQSLFEEREKMRIKWIQDMKIYESSLLSPSSSSSGSSGIGGSNPPDEPSFSTRSLSSGDNIEYYASAATIIQPLTNAWTISFRVQFVPSSGGYAQIVINTVTPDFCEFVVELFEGFIGVVANTPGGSQYYVAYTPPETATADWTHVTITRDPAFIDDWTPGSCLRVFINSVEDTSGIFAGSGSYASVGATPSTLAIRAGNYTSQSAYLDEIYMCSHVCTPTEVTTVLYPNLMETDDGGWGRQFWYRIEDTDSDSTIQNNPVDGSTVLTSSIIGALSTNVDPVIS